MEDIKINKVRLNHLNYYLSRHDKFKTILAESGTKNFEKGDSIFPFPAILWTLVEKLALNGIDPCTLKAKQVVMWAEFLLLGGPSPTAHAKADVGTSHSSTELAKVEAPGLEAPLPALSPRGTGLHKLPARLPIATLLFAALEITPFDKHPNADADRKALEELCIRYQDFAIPESSQSGKTNA